MDKNVKSNHTRNIDKVEVVLVVVFSSSTGAVADEAVAVVAAWR